MTAMKQANKDEDFSNKCILSELEDGVTPERVATLKRMMEIHYRARAKKKKFLASRAKTPPALEKHI